jgi:hypothetical protein
MAPESLNSAARRDNRYYATARENRPRSNKYTCNKRRTAGRGVFYVVRTEANLQFVVKGK